MAEVVRSAANPRLRRLRALARRREREASGLFVAAGEDLVACALDAGVQPVDVLVRDGADDLAPALREAVGPVAVTVAAPVLDAAGPLAHGARLIGVFAASDLPAAPARPSLAVLLDGVADPGNVGTVLRAAQAFGADLVALLPGTADHLGPKAVRASMGAVFALPVARVEAAGGAAPGARLVALDGASPVTLADADLTRPVALLVGAERAGLSAAARAAADATCRIEQTGPVGSLNAAMAATVALYEASRRP